jgi:hypothetical protein
MKRIGENGLAYFLYLSTSRHTGRMLASTFLCVSTTPFGSAVAPDVKMISIVSSLVIATGVRIEGSRSRQTMSDSRQVAAPTSRRSSTSSPSSTSFALTMRETLVRKSREAR